MPEGARLFRTPRHQVRRVRVGVFPVSAARGKTCGLGRAGAVGVFSDVHSKNFARHSTGNSTGMAVNFFYRG
jgi:hypothetical protein